jgi:hypothetical protein
MGRWTIVNAVLGIMVALLGFEIARTWAQRLPPVEVPASAGPPAAAAPAEPHEKGGKRGSDKNAARAPQTPATMVATITEKDLFDPSRRPPSPEEIKVEVAPVTKPPDNVTVVGVRIFGKDREVFMNDGTQTPAAGRRLRLGDQIAGFTVKAIEPTGAVLTSPSGDTVAMPLTLDKSRSGAQPGQPATTRTTPVRTTSRGQQPAAAATPSSPAAGSQGSSPAAGVAVKPATPPTGARGTVPTPAQPGQVQPSQLPSQVLQKLEQLRQNDKRPGRKR